MLSPLLGKAKSDLPGHQVLWLLGKYRPAGGCARYCIQLFPPSESRGRSAKVRMIIGPTRNQNPGRGATGTTAAHRCDCGGESKGTSRAEAPLSVVQTEKKRKEGGVSQENLCVKFVLSRRTIESLIPKNFSNVRFRRPMR